MDIDSQKFEELVDAAWNKLPQEFREQIDNAVIVVETEPTKEQLRRMKIKGLLLGLFEGVPKTAWGQTFSSSIIPGKITIFRNPISHISKNLKDLKITIHVVLMHEIAHYFGYNEEAMFIMDKRMRARLSKEIE